MWIQPGSMTSLDNGVAKASLNSFPWKLNCDSEHTIPTIECVEILTSLFDEFGSRVTQYLIGLYTNTAGAGSIIHLSSLQQSMVLDPSQQCWYKKNSLPLQPNKEAKCRTNPSDFISSKPYKECPLVSQDIFTNFKNLSIILTLLLWNAINIWTVGFSRITYGKLKSPWNTQCSMSF